MPPGRVELEESQRAVLLDVLRTARFEGLLGPGPVETHVDHALGFADIVGDPGGRALDLGSGAGVPGLTLAFACPSSGWLLLDGRRRSAVFLTEAISRLGLVGRVRVLEGRAEDMARTPLRGRLDLVVARGMGCPGATAECAAGFLRVGGRLVVSEPPAEDYGRWSSSGLGALGMGEASWVESRSGAHFVVVRQETYCPERFPRRTGQPMKRPLF